MQKDQTDITEKQNKTEEIIKEYQKQLERKAGLTIEQAREELVESLKEEARLHVNNYVESLKEDARMQVNNYFKNLVDEARMHAEDQSINIVFDNIQRSAT